MIFSPAGPALGMPVDDCLCDSSQVANRNAFLFKQVHGVRRIPNAKLGMSAANNMNVRRAVIVRIHHDSVATEQE